MQDATQLARSLRTRFVGDSLRYAPSVLIPAAAGVGSVTIFTRLLSPGDYGLYSIVMAVVAILVVVCSGWIEQAALRYLPDARDHAPARASTGHVIGLTLAVCAMTTGVAIGVAVVGAPRRGEYGGLWVPSAMLLIGEAAFVSLAAVLQARLRSQVLSTLRIAGAVLRLLMAVGFVLWIGRDVRWVIIGSAIGRGIVTVITLLVVAREDHQWVTPRWDGKNVRRYAAYGVPMVGWALGSQALAVSDRFVIGAFAGSAAVGVYAANYNLVAMGFGLLSAPLLMAAHPLIVNAWKEHSRADVMDIITDFSRLYVYVIAPLLVVIALCSREIAGVLLGEEFRGGNHVIPILVLGMMVRGFSMYAHKGLELAERTRLMFVLMAICAVVNVLLNLIFVPLYGFTAAAVTTVVGYVLYAVLVQWASRHQTPWRIPWRSIGGALAAAIAALVAGGLVRNSVAHYHPILVIVITGVVSVLVYAAALSAAHRWHRRERKAGV
jgi:O-antigen/teichoic acid export membrane protein